MALHPELPTSPYKTLPPEQRWFPADETLRSALTKNCCRRWSQTLREVTGWRDAGYAGASATSRALLQWWFETEHLVEAADGTLSTFRYYFAQREAVETVIWLYDVRGVRDKFDLMRFDASGAVCASMFDEDWPRFVVKMATGAGKTKVLSLLHRLELLPQALRAGFGAGAQLPGHRAEHHRAGPRCGPTSRACASSSTTRSCPTTATTGRNWRDDFQLTLHIQDDVRVVRHTGNIFLTNIHRVYLGDVPRAVAGRRRPARLLPRARSARSRSARPPTARSTSARSSARSTNWPCSTTRRTTSTTRAWPGSSPSRTSTTGCCRRTAAWRCRWT